MNNVRIIVPTVFTSVLNVLCLSHGLGIIQDSIHEFVHVENLDYVVKVFGMFLAQSVPNCS